MDDDLEKTRPEILPRFLAKLDEGFDVVYGIRKQPSSLSIGCSIGYFTGCPAVWTSISPTTLKLPPCGS